MGAVEGEDQGGQGVEWWGVIYYPDLIEKLDVSWMIGLVFFQWVLW